MAKKAQLSKEAAAILRKLLVKPILMSEQEISENVKALRELTTIDPVTEESLVRIVGDPRTGRFVILSDYLGDESAEQRMILDMVKDSTGIKLFKLLYWAEDLQLDIEDFGNTLEYLFELGVLEKAKDGIIRYR